MPEENLKKIRKKKCDYVLAVKQNPPMMFEEINELFEVEERESWQVYERGTKGTEELREGSTRSILTSAGFQT